MGKVRCLTRFEVSLTEVAVAGAGKSVLACVWEPLPSAGFDLVTALP
jgi:hypothetical protein